MSNATVQVGELVVVQVVVEVKIMDIPRQSRPEGDGYLGLEEFDCGICVGGKATKATPLTGQRKCLSELAGEETYLYDAPEKLSTVSCYKITNNLTV